MDYKLKRHSDEKVGHSDIKLEKLKSFVAGYTFKASIEGTHTNTKWKMEKSSQTNMQAADHQ